MSATKIKHSQQGLFAGAAGEGHKWQLKDITRKLASLIA